MVTLPAMAISVQKPKLIAQISQGPVLMPILPSSVSTPSAPASRRGRRTSSPPQCGQRFCLLVLQAGQNVHSKEDTYASARCSRTASQPSEVFFTLGLSSGVVRARSLDHPQDV